MIIGEGSQGAPLFLPEGVEAHVLIKGLACDRNGNPWPVKENQETKDPFAGNPVYQFSIQFEILDGEYAGTPVRETFWVRCTPQNGAYGNNSAIQSLWTSAGIQERLGTNDEGKKIYPWPANAKEVADMVDNKGEYEIENLGLKGCIAKIVTGEPRVNVRKNDDGTESTRTYTNITHYASVEPADREALAAVVTTLDGVSVPDDDMPY